VKMFESTKIPVLSRALEAYALRHKTIATNLANITTTGYKARTVKFEEELSSAMVDTGLAGIRTDPHHLPIGAITASAARPVVEETQPEGGLSGDQMASGVNNVDLDNEMAELAKNQIRFRFAARLVTDTFKGIQKSIRGTQ
jgi:flagellar basal-body rod protein FlgB